MTDRGFSTVSVPPADTAPSPVASALWQEAAADAPLASGEGPDALPAEANLLVIAAHPDDEVIGAGRIMAHHGGRVRAITLTAGERCHGDGADRRYVAQIRLDEWRAALNVLGAEPLDSTRWPDGCLAGHEPEATQALMGMMELMECVGGVDALLAPWQHDPHPDHEAAGRIAVQVSHRLGVPLWSYLVWTPYWLHPREVGRYGGELVNHPTAPEAGFRWRRALACHRSQLTAQPPAEHPVVPTELIRRHDLPDRQLLLRRQDARQP